LPQALDLHQAVRFVELMKERLDEDVMTTVFAQLLIHEPPAVPRRKTYRRRQLKEALGGISDFTLDRLIAEGKCPPGRQITPRIRVWTDAEVAAIAATVIDGQEEK
jgi:predicted DNA-binding transcriptional regulator AlpA